MNYNKLVPQSIDIADKSIVLWVKRRMNVLSLH